MLGLYSPVAGRLSASPVPRFIRRHYTQALPKTRRQRRVWARILRISRRKGIIS